MFNRGASLGRGIAPLRTIDTFSLYGTTASYGTAPTSAAFPTANKIFYSPIRTPCPLVIAQLYAHNGAAVSGNIEVGLYSADGRRLVTSGSVAQAGTSIAQTFDIADTLIGEDVFYLAVSLDNTTGTLFRTAYAVGLCQAAGMLTETTVSFGLPAIATWSAIADAYAPRMGVSMAAVL